MAGRAGSKRGVQRAKPVIGSGLPGSLYHDMRCFLDWLLLHNYSPRTVEKREEDLRQFILWCEDRGLLAAGEITLPVLERFQRYLYLYRKPGGAPLAVSSQIDKLGALRAWFRYLVRQRRILSNPASELEMPRAVFRLPRAVLSPEEMEAVLAVPDVSAPQGLRDRAMLEVFYTTGIRRLEMTGLGLHDIDTERGVAMVRQGKGRRDRVVPVGARALLWVARYRDEARPLLAMGRDDGFLFLNRYGERMNANVVSTMVRKAIEASGTPKRGSSHVLRHTCATLMLEGGADVRFIQALLGHVKLDTTSIYTRVSIRALKTIHEATHPGCNGGGQKLAKAELGAAARSLLAEIDLDAED